MPKVELTCWVHSGRNPRPELEESKIYLLGLAKFDKAILRLHEFKLTLQFNTEKSDSFIEVCYDGRPPHEILYHSFTVPGSSKIVREDNITVPERVRATAIWDGNPSNPFAAIERVMRDSGPRPTNLVRSGPLRDCVATTISKLLDRPTPESFVEENLWAAGLKQGSPDWYLLEVLRGTKKVLVFQYYPDTETFLNSPGRLFENADDEFVSPLMGVGYEFYDTDVRKLRRHCVVYHGHPDFTGRFNNFYDRFVCYQLDYKKGESQKEIFKALHEERIPGGIRYVFMFLPTESFKSVNDYLPVGPLEWKVIGDI